MDATTLLLESLFGVIFVWALRAWWLRRDPLSRDVVLVFSAMGALFGLQLITLVAGPASPVLHAIALVLLLGQPTFTLRLAAEIHPVPRAVLAGATVGWLAATVPLVVLGSPPPVVVALAAVAVFVVSEAAAAAYLAAAARRRAGAAPESASSARNPR